MPDVKDRTPLEEALKDHLQDQALVPACAKALWCAHMATEDDRNLPMLDWLVKLPHGEEVPVHKLITDLHLNEFIHLGGRENL